MPRNNLVRLDGLPGKYHVKTLQPGTMLKTDMLTLGMSKSDR